jgi:hypothetical protein
VDGGAQIEVVEGEPAGDLHPAQGADTRPAAGYLPTRSNAAPSHPCSTTPSMKPLAQRAAHQDESAGAEVETTKTTAAIERYLTAFENGFMPETTWAPASRP